MMPQWLKDLLGFIRELPVAARSLTTLALVSLGAAVAWQGSVGSGTGGVIRWGPPAALIFITLVFLLLAGYYSVAEKVGQVARQVGQIERKLVAHVQMAPAYHVGCRVGRRRLECGVLDVRANGLPARDEARHWSDDAVREGRLFDGALLGRTEHSRLTRSEIYSWLVRTIIEFFHAADRKGVSIASIGIAVPGGVNPRRGTFEGVVDGVPFGNGEEITTVVAELLARELDAQILRQIFGTSQVDEMRNQIHLDNDARCAARWLLVEEPEWRDFVCVFTGSGLGSGLVFDRRVFYGNRFRAGEVGHVNLNAGTRLPLDDGAKGWILEPRHCSCGQDGFHFESLVGIGGLGHLARVIDSDLVASMRKVYEKDDNRRSQIAANKIDQDDADGIMMLRSLASVAQPVPHIPAMQDPVFEQHVQTDEAFLDAIHSDPIRPYLALVATHFGRLFGTGLAALQATLDVDHIALCGTVPEFLQHNYEFVQAVQESLLHEPGMRRGNSPEYGSMLRWAWRGAALLPRDSGYLSRRF